MNTIANHDYYEDLLRRIDSPEGMHAQFLRWLSEENRMKLDEAYRMVTAVSIIEEKALKPLCTRSAPQLACFMIAGGMDAGQAMTAIALLLQAYIMQRRARRRDDPDPDFSLSALQLYIEFLALMLTRLL
ncbi:MAG: hypothetical protein K2F77_00895 [Muribaculaceae bacterium]|nr:hypothetical protein [Muribaculaceae bacterium]